MSFLLGQMPTVQASTEGCPGSWTIDTSSPDARGIQQLQQIKQRLGSDMVLTEEDATYTNYSGETGPIAPPKGGRLSFPDLYLYGNTFIAKKYIVQVKNCPSPETFLINLGTLKEWASVKSILVDVNSTEWAMKNEHFFENFVLASKFSECLAKKKSVLQKPGNIQHQYFGKNLVILNAADFITAPPSKNCGLRINMTLVDKTPSCRYMNSPSNGGPARLGISITMGNKCSFAFAAGDETGNLNLFEKFTIDSNNWRTSIICVKGKSKKTLQGLVGYEFKMKCPTGYKKK